MTHPRTFLVDMGSARRYVAGAALSNSTVPEECLVDGHSSPSQGTVISGRPGAMRTLVACSIGAACGIFAFSIAVGITGSWAAASVIAVLVAGLVAWAYRARPIVPIDEAACSRGLKIVSALATIAALVQLARLAVFMVDPQRPAYSVFPSSDWEVRHSCVSAYFVAARAADRVPSIYADSLYTSPDDDPTTVRKALMMGPFKIDVYEYPPPFLLLPRAFRLVAPDFERFRTMWFGLNSAVVLLAMLVLARALGPAAGTDRESTRLNA